MDTRRFIFSSRHSSPETTIEMTVRESEHPEYIDTAEDGAHCDSGEEPGGPTRLVSKTDSPLIEVDDFHFLRRGQFEG